MTPLNQFLSKRRMRPNVPIVFQCIGIFLLTVTVTVIVLPSENFQPFYDTQDDNVKESITNKSATENSSITEIDKEFFNYVASNMRDTPYPGVWDYSLYSKIRRGLKPLQHVKALQPELGQIVNDLTSFDYPIKLQECNSNVPSNNIFLAIFSAPSYFHKRESIRNTWLPHFKNQSLINLVGYGFILGLPKDYKVQKQIHEENQTFSDILQIDMIDDYYNLTLKTAGLMNWLNRHCSQVDFVMKVDDDMFVNVRSLASIVQALDPSELSVYGSKIKNVPLRSGKWWVSFEDWPWLKYPTYPTGNAVLISGVAVKPLLAAAQTIPFIPFEDTYMYGLCAEKAKVKIRFSDRPFVERMPKTWIAPCHVHRSITWITNSPTNMNISHWAIEEYFNGKTKCIIENSDDPTGTKVNPWDVPPLSFTN